MRVIKAKHDGQYKEVGFIKVRQPDGTYKDVDKKYGKTSSGEYGLVFEKGFTRSKEGVLPLVIDGIGKPLKDYDIEGNTYQSDGVTPDTPQEVVGVAERTGNLINIIPFKATFGTGSAVIRDFLNSLDIGAYVVSYNIELLTRNDSTDNSIYGIRVINQSGNFELTPSWSSASIGTVKKISLKITITEDNKGKFTNVYFYGCGMFSVGATGSAQIYDFMLNSGSTPLPYEPYGYKVDVECRGKNLFNGTIEQGSLADVNGSLVESLTRVRTTKISVSEDTTYTISSNLMPRNIIAYKNNTFFAQVYDGAALAKTSCSFTVPAGVNQIAVAFKGNQAGNINITPNDLEWLMLNEGDTAEPYEPYHEPITTPIYLDFPLYKIGDYSDSIGMTEEVRRIGVVDLGTLTYTKSSTSGNFTSIEALPNARKISNTDTGNAICSAFKEVQANQVTDIPYSFSSTLNSSSRVYINGTGFEDMTAEDFKTAMKGVYVYYILATPETKTVEPVEIPTLNGTTVIDVGMEVKPSNMWVEYKSSTSEYNPVALRTANNQVLYTADGEPIRTLQ